jgi:hypothetical protein
VATAAATNALLTQDEQRARDRVVRCGVIIGNRANAAGRRGGRGLRARARARG